MVRSLRGVRGSGPKRTACVIQLFCMNLKVYRFFFSLHWGVIEILFFVNTLSYQYYYTGDPVEFNAIRCVLPFVFTYFIVCQFDFSSYDIHSALQSHTHCHPVPYSRRKFDFSRTKIKNKILWKFIHWKRYTCVLVHLTMVIHYRFYLTYTYLISD